MQEPKISISDIPGLKELHIKCEFCNNPAVFVVYSNPLSYIALCIQHKRQLAREIYE